MRTSHLITALLTSLGFCAASQAGNPPAVFQDTAWVVSSNPVYEDVNEPRSEQHCRTTDNWGKRLAGYDVAYRYHGQTLTAFMPHDPGRTVRVDVSVRLAEH